MFPALAAKGVQVDLLADTTSPYFDPLRASGFPITALKMRSRIDFRAIRAIRSQLKVGRHEILHAFNSRALSNSLIASAGLNVKRIGYCGTMGHLRHWDPSGYLSLLNPRVDRIVCISDAVRSYLGSMGIPPHRLIRIYKGHDPDWFTPSPRTALREFGIPDDAFVIGCTANTRPIKGVPILIKAVEQLAPALPVHLLLVGANRDETVLRLARQGVAADRLHLPGFRMDAPELMGACDVFVMPTLKNEGFSKAVIEAMCMGVPPVISSVGGMIELVADNETGLIVPPNDPARLAVALSRYASEPDLRRRHGLAARARVRTRFSFDTMVNETLDLYRAVTPCASAGQ